MARRSTRRQFLGYGSAVIGTSIFLKACGVRSPAPVSTPAASPTGGSGDFKAAIVLPGVITDRAWNQAGYEGLGAIKSKLNADIAYVEKVAQADQAEALSDFARRGFNLVYAHGGQFDAAIQQVAPQFPKTFFIGVNGAAAGANFAALRIDHLQASYLCGMIGATLSKTNRLAYLAGQEFQATQEELRGFELGARSIKPDVQISSNFTGDWNDVAKAKAAAEAIIATGADVIYQWLDNAAPTVLQTAADRGIYAFGNTVDQLAVAPKAVLTSAVKRIDLAIAYLAERASQNQLKGEVYNLGLEREDILYLGKFNSIVPQTLQATVQQTKTAILAGKLSFEPCSEGGKPTRCAKGAVL